MSANKLHLKIPSQTEKLYAVRSFVAEAAHSFGFDEETMNKISIAVDEACTNIIKHSYKFAPNKEIDITIVMNGSKFEVVIAHRGASFDPDAVKPPNMKEYLSHYRKGGLGMHLMRSLMDKVEYRIVSNLQNEVHLIKFLPVKINR
jgi:serine/threonine-protein kinase RsbW